MNSCSLSLRTCKGGNYANATDDRIMLGGMVEIIAAPPSLAPPSLMDGPSSPITLASIANG